MTRDHVITVTLDPRFTRLLERQRANQAFFHPEGLENLDKKTQAEFIRTQAFALIAEVIEAVEETHWKPWATPPNGESVVYNRDRYTSELADVFIFLMNLMLVGQVTMTDFAQAVDSKQTKNMQRWISGYDGKSSKCYHCKRAYDDTDVKCFPGSDASYGWCEKTGGHVNREGNMLP